jgi:lipopolysaccharide biosynthesis glycosyltransferase
MWIADDTIPMYKKFASCFLEEIKKPNVGVACLEVSKEYKTHIRTSGFILPKEVSKKLIFPVEVIKTKLECYFFEHRNNNSFYEQILRMGKKVIQVSPNLMVSHLWDTGQRIKLNRWEDYYKEFPNTEKISITSRVDKICITTVFDKNYLEAGKTLFNSIKRHTDCVGIDFKVITSDIEVLKEFGEKNCHFVTEEIKNRYNNVQYSKDLPKEKYSTSWYRYEIFNMTDYDRVICIDSDCICIQDISYLFDKQLSQYDLISVKDHIVSKLIVPNSLKNPNFSNLNKRASENKIDIQPAVLIANKSIVSNSWYKKLLDYANTCPFSYALDEGVLNDFIYMENIKIKLLPLEWDYQDLYEIYCPELILTSKPIIIHCQESKPFKKLKSEVNPKLHKWYDLWKKENKTMQNERIITKIDLIDYSRKGHNTEFKSNKKVTFIVPIFNTFPTIIGDLMFQSHSNWELLLIHDGANFTNLQALIDVINDPRIIYIETKERKGFWGHSIRKWAIEQIRDGIFPKTDFIVVSNPDNHHAIPYISKMIQPLVNNPNLVGSYCSQMVHNYVNYDVMECSLKRGYLDCASAIIKADVACDIGWNNTTHISADWFYIEDIIKKYGKNRFIKVKGCLLVHN